MSQRDEAAAQACATFRCAQADKHGPLVLCKKMTVASQLSHRSHESVEELCSRGVRAAAGLVRDGETNREDDLGSERRPAAC